MSLSRRKSVTYLWWGEATDEPTLQQFRQFLYVDAQQPTAHIRCVMARRKKKLSPEKMREFIHSLRGSLKRKPGEKSILQELVEERRAEKAKEDRDMQPG